MPSSPQKNIFLVHDSLIQFGGAERVFKAFVELWPEAPIYTLVITDAWKKSIGRSVRASILQALFRVFSNFKYYLVLLPIGIWFLPTKKADVIVSSSSLFLKALPKRKDAIHIQYCHTPPRFLWTEHQYVDQEAPVLLRPLVKILMTPFRWWDKYSSKKVDHYITNSRETQKRIQEFYGRSSTIIYPYIDTRFWKPTRAKGDYFLIAGRLHAHKDGDKIIRIFNQLGLPLHVAGEGRQKEYLESIAEKNITFIGKVSDEQLRDEFSGALGFIYPQFEDFGIMPLEAAACGTATLGLAAGGSLETIKPGITGELFPDQTDASMLSYITEWDGSRYTLDNLRAHAERFSRERFDKEILEFVGKVLH
jgi:glycosyltransferase involved in cell wall biosynthesis